MGDFSLMPGRPYLSSAHRRGSGGAHQPRNSCAELAERRGCLLMVTRAAAQNVQASGPDVSPDLREDALVLPTVATYLSRGVELLKWWREVESKGGPEIQFPIERSFNRPTRSFGFYGEAPVEGRMMPVMGNVQEMFYDQTRAPESLNRESAEWMWEQIREFVMKYFMRVSSFRQPEAFVDASYPIAPPALAWLSWCPSPSSNQ